MVTGTGLGVGNKMLKQDRLGLRLQTGTGREGNEEQRPSQEYDRASKGLYCLSNLMILRFGER